MSGARFDVAAILAEVEASESVLMDEGYIGDGIGTTKATTKRPQHEGGMRAVSGHRLGEWHQRVKSKDDVVAAARDMRREGKTYKEISDALGESYWTVRDWVQFRTRSSA